MFYKLSLSLLLTVLLLAVSGVAQETKQAPQEDPILVKVLSPNGGEKWEVSSSQTVTWETTARSEPDSIQIVLVHKADDSATPDPKLVPVLLTTLYKKNPGKWVWAKVEPVAKDVKISVTAYFGKRSAKDVSDKYFSIENAAPTPAIQVTSPNGNEKWLVGTSHDITWALRSLPEFEDPTKSAELQVAVYLSRDGGLTYPEELAKGIKIAAKTFAWNDIPGPAGNQCRVKLIITGPRGTEHMDVSDADFEITSSIARPPVEGTPH